VPLEWSSVHAFTNACRLLARIVYTAFAQSDRGTITGTVSDSSGGVVANTDVQATNTVSGAVYNATTTPTGNYTIPQVVTGTYDE
jgi:hypothetical protein